MRALRLAWLLAALPLASCDWEHFATMNSVPVRGDPAHNPVVDVYLGLDGLPWGALQWARERGAFAGPAWRQAQLVPMFPATSDASWTRMLRAPRFNGYEFGYYDPEADTLHNTDLGGLLVHVIPPLENSPLQPPASARAPAYYRGFTWHAGEYLDALWSYDRPVLSFHRALDALFVSLGGRAERDASFSAYVLEGDVIGHMRSEEDVVAALVALSDRIERFRRAHPERTFRFTLFGDHGLDFVQKPSWGVVDFRDQLRAQGVRVVEALRDAGGATPAAVVVMHTRVTYVALHARPEHVQDVAAAASRAPAADLAVARALPAPGAPEGLEWTGAWRAGALAARFGYRRATDTYWLPADVDWAALDLPVQVPAGAPGVELDDEALFALSAARTYPDFFFRTRTALEPVSVRFPADVVVSFRAPYMSVGYAPPGGGGTDIGTAGSHGALDRTGSTGALLTEAVDALPPVVRSDTLLELVPGLADHLRFRGLPPAPAPEGAALDYARVQ